MSLSPIEILGVVSSFLSIKGVFPKKDKIPKTSAPILTKKDDLRAFFREVLLFFKKDRCYDYNIEACLEKYNNDFFQCTIAYKYTKIINNKYKKIIFRINRMSKEEHLREPKIPNDVFEFEHSWDFDERNFFEQTKDWTVEKIQELYNIKNLKLTVDSRISGEEIPLTVKPQDGKYGKELLFLTGELPDKFIGKPVILEYTVKCIFEKTSYVYFDTDIPTRAFSLKFDYSKVADQIAIDCVDFLSSYKCANIGYRPNNHVFSLTNLENWVIPRSSFIVIWSEKKFLPKKLNLKKGVFE
jgi:hypothetical protein